MKILVTGAGGFIGGHLTKRLIDEGHEVYSVDIKPLNDWWQSWGTKVFPQKDLRKEAVARQIMEEVMPDRVFALAADMGGMGFISFNDALILHNNLMINLNTLHAAYEAGVSRYLFTSSACVYPESLQMNDDVVPKLKESDAYPADPQDAYGWEKLTTEKLLEAYRDDYDMDTRIVRFHNTYGPFGSWTGGREKAPAALCRKVAESKLAGDNPISIDVWGDGQATRTYMYIDDCVEGLLRLMDSDYQEPLNLGSDELVTVDELATACYVASMPPVEDEAIWIYPNFVITHVNGPQGVRNRDADLSKVKKVLGWEPTVSLQQGISKTYEWIEEQVTTQSTKSQ